jgi:hypothetical protein
VTMLSLPDPAGYRDKGYVLLEQLVPRAVATGMLARLRGDFARQGIDLAGQEKQGPLLARPAIEIYGYHYPMFVAFHWGLTASVSALVGAELLPSYCYFRIYRQGDICRVHGDRPACEHSVSLTLGYGDDLLWPLEVAHRRIDQPYERADEAFAANEEASAVAMMPGDGVLYQGVHHHHGRTMPNPNRWSAHLFLHWVAKDGPFADQAFDGQKVPDRVEF